MKNEPKDDNKVGRAPPKLPLTPIDEMDWSQLDLTLPYDVVQYKDVVPIADNKLKIGDSFICTVGCIYDLSKFWILNLSMTNWMHSFWGFYNNLGSNYKMLPLLVREKLYCVAYWDDKYYRVTILKVLDNQPDFVQVFFIDFGLTYCVYIENLYYLHKLYAKEPAQVIRARLANIVPLRRNDIWSGEAVKKLCEFTAVTLPLNATVVAVDEDMVLNIFLSNNFAGKCINNILVDEGYALRDYEEEEALTFYDPNCIPLVDNLHLYPTFDELESGDMTRCSIGNYKLNPIMLAHWCMSLYFDITLSWTDSIFDDVEKNYEQNSTNIHLINDISITKYGEGDFSIVNEADIKEFEKSLINKLNLELEYTIQLCMADDLLKKKK